MLVNVKICINCLKIGHLAVNCTEERSNEVKCLRCTSVGHKAKDCQEERKCLVCNVEGHSCNNTSCPAYRKAIEKSRNARKTNL